MQIASSYSSSNATTSDKSASSSKSSGSQTDAFYQQLADYGSPQNPLFQNLLKDDSVQDNVTLNKDGTYTWTDNADGSLGGYQEWLAKQLISQQNGTEPAPDPGTVSAYTVNDNAKFRELTGYNLVHTGDVTFITDDYGNAPPASETDRLNAAWQTFDLAKGVQDLENPGGGDADLSYDDLKNAAQGVKESSSLQGQNTSGIDTIMDAIDEMNKDQQANAA